VNIGALNFIKHFWAQRNRQVQKNK
jgi:hypothetical protein